MVRLSREVGQTRSVLYEENRQRYLFASISFLSHFDISHCGKSAVIQHGLITPTILTYDVF